MTDSLKGIGSGILQPVLAYRFRIRIQNQDKEAEHRMAMQAVSCVADYVNKTLTIVLEQDLLTTDICWALYNRTDILTPVFVEHMDGGGNATSSIQYNCRMADHKYELNYASNKAASHVIVYDIKEMIPYEPVAETPE